MASQIVAELRVTTDAVWNKLSAQLQGMDCHMERTTGPGEWTTRQVLCHLLGAPGWRPVPVLSTFVKAEPGESVELPVIDIQPGQCHVTPERQMMKLQQFKNAIDRHRREVFEYLQTYLTMIFSGKRAFRCSSSSWAPTRSRCRSGSAPTSWCTGAITWASWPRSGRRWACRRRARW